MEGSLASGAGSLSIRIGLGYVLGVREQEVRALVVERERGGIGHSANVTVGDWVSIRWSWACEELPVAALGWLRRMTAEAITRANRTL